MNGTAYGGYFMIDEKRYREIALELNLQTVIKPSNLFKIVRQSHYELEEKVGFLLRWFGWHDKRVCISNDLKKAQNANYPFFRKGIHFIQQFDGLIFPGKCTSSRQGSHILLSFIWNPVILEGVSHHFGERVISIGTEHLFDGYDENIPDCWEDISIPPDDLDYDFIALFLGESGKIYWLCYDGDSLGIAANSILEFFANRFSFINDCGTSNTCSLWTTEDKKIMHDFKRGKEFCGRYSYPNRI